MSSLELVITMLLLTSVEGDAAVAVPWKEEGEVPAWSDGGGGTQKLLIDICGRQDAKSTPKTTGPQFKLCSKFEKGLNKNILSRKRDKHTEKLGGGMRRI